MGTVALHIEKHNLYNTVVAMRPTNLLTFLENFKKLPKEMSPKSVLVKKNCVTSYFEFYCNSRSYVS